MIPWMIHLGVWLFIAVAHVVLPIGLFWRRPAENGGRARRLTITYATLTAAWGASGALIAFSSASPHVGGFARIVFNSLAPVAAGLTLALECAFIQKGENWSACMMAGMWGGVVFAVGLYSRRSTYFPWTDETLAAIGWVVLWGILSVTWLGRYTRSEWAFRRNRALYWTWAAVLLLVGQALMVFASWPVGAVGLLLHLVGVMFIAVAVTRRYLPNVRAMLRRSLSFSIMIVLVALVLLVGFWAVLSWLHPQSLEPMVVGLAIVIAAITALIYGPAHKLIDRLTMQLIPHHIGCDVEEKLREYSLVVSNIIDVDQLAAMAVETVSETLNVQQAILILVIEEAEEETGKVRLQPLTGIGEFPKTEFPVDSSSPIIRHLRDQQKPLFRRELAQGPIFHDLPPRLQAWLQEIGAEVYVPISAQSSLLAILAIGPLYSGELLGKRDQAFLSTLASQTAVALQNARLFEDMRALNMEITQLNEDLQRAVKRAERLDQAKTDFLAVASHELRTPLTHVKGYADLLSELSDIQAITPEQTAEIARSIGKATGKLETIVKAMIDLSQIEGAKLDLFFAPTTLTAVMRMALEPWVEPLRLRNMHLTIEGIDTIPPIVVDLQRLAQAFSNLISNAIKYTPDGGQISIRAWQIDATHFQVAVIDSGVGIDSTDQELIFDKFFRASDINQHSSGTYKFMGGGPGLGLSIARGMIEAHGGRIWVDSKQRDEISCPGSTFHVILPLRAGPVGDQASQIEPDTEPSPPS